MKTYLDSWLEKQKPKLSTWQLTLAKQYVMCRFRKGEPIERAIAMFMIRFNKRYNFSFFSKEEINFEYYY